MVTKVVTGAILGVECRIVTVEADVSNGLPQMEMVGKLSPEVREAEKRVRVALRNIGIPMPPKRITINLAPAALQKEGTAYDLPIAVALLTAMGMIPEERLEGTFIAGELGLNGEIKSVRGILPMVLSARECGMRRCILPGCNRQEGSVVSGIGVYGYENLSELLRDLKEPALPAQGIGENAGTDREVEAVYPDYDEIYGQEGMKRAMVIAAAGFHNLLMIGSPGAGKTMAARRLGGIMPPMKEEEQLEVSKIYSVSGLLHEKEALVRERPFIAPHHTATLQSLAGGGRIPVPGLISRAHKGVLFLDEAVHFSSPVLEVLRQPLEEKKIMIARSSGNYVFPAEFMLVMAINPCPCGNYPDPERCSCTEEQVRRYLGRLSGPLLDRIDLCIEMGRLKPEVLQKSTDRKKALGSEEMRSRVIRARAMQEERFRGTGLLFNAQMGVKDIERYITLKKKEAAFMQDAYERMHLSLRSYHRLLRVARTIADLEEAEEVELKHLNEALCYRGVEDRYWHGGAAI